MAANKGGIVKRVAEERIGILYGLSKEEYSDRSRALEKVYKADQQIGRHYKITLPDLVKRGFCKKCNSVFMPGQNVSIRLASSKRFVVYKCLLCGCEAHIHY